MSDALTGYLFWGLVVAVRLLTSGFALGVLVGVALALFAR